MASVETENPLLTHHFGVEIQGKIAGYFTECSGLGSETELVEHKVVQNGKEIVMKIPGRLKWDDITLKRGITSSMDIWAWRQEIINGGVDAGRQNGSVVAYNQELVEVARWNFERAWPSKVTGPTPKSDSSEVGMEELVITHEYIERVS
jgi:phage tail-like protein